LLITGCNLNGYKLDEDNKTIIIRTDGQNFTCHVPFQLHGIYEEDKSHISLFDNRINLEIKVYNNLKKGGIDNFSKLDGVILNGCESLERSGMQANFLVIRDDFINKEITTKNNKKIQAAYLYRDQDSLKAMKINTKHLVVAMVNDNIGYQIHLSIRHYEQEDEKIFVELLNSLDFIEEN
jgi:hypothetical protein